MAKNLKPGITAEVGDVVFGAGEVIVDDNDLVTSAKKALRKMRTDKSGPAGDENAHADNATHQSGSRRLKNSVETLLPHLLNNLFDILRMLFCRHQKSIRGVNHDDVVHTEKGNNPPGCADHYSAGVVWVDFR